MDLTMQFTDHPSYLLFS